MGRRIKRGVSLNESERVIFDKLKRIDPAEFPSGAGWVRALLAVDPEVTMTVFEALVGFWGKSGARGFSKGSWYSSVKEWRLENGLPKNMGYTKQGHRRPANCEHSGVAAGKAGPSNSRRPSSLSKMAMAEVEAILNKGYVLGADGIARPAPGRVKALKGSHKRTTPVLLSDAERATFDRLRDIEPGIRAKEWIQKLIATDPSITSSVYEALAAAWGVLSVTGYSTSSYYRLVADWRESVGLPRQMGTSGSSGIRQSANVGMQSKQVAEEQAAPPATSEPSHCIDEQLVDVFKWMRRYSVESILLDAKSCEVLMSNKPVKQKAADIKLKWKLA
tara:strand:- start:36 stop:1034 length:999 start_codon:yes stop_codon:yes gene_type:complete